MTEPFYFKRYDMVIGKAVNTEELRKELERLKTEDPYAVLYHIKEGHISNWLVSIDRKDLANAIKPSMTIDETIEVLSGHSRMHRGGPRGGQHRQGGKPGPKGTFQNRD
ncbi:MAG: hypothetical protein ACP5OC_08050 [Thermoplasmata archaeon]